MSATVHVSLAEYMSTEYEPDCDYVDGRIEERNGGKQRHSRTQGLLFGWLLAREAQHGRRALVEQRVRLSPSMVRIPDICLIDPADDNEVTQTPPALCIEILSPEDRWSRVQARLADFLNFGVPMVWVVDPYSKQAWIATATKAATLVTDGKLRCAELNLEVELREILPAD
jgi:Uma2 family endonuclease